MSEEYENVFIGDKPIGSYLTAGLWALSQDEPKPIRLLGRGNNIKTTVDVAEILKRQMISSETIIEIGSESHNERKVSTISIILIGKKKKEKKNGKK